MGRTNRRHSRERHGDDSTELLWRNENEEAGCVDAVSRHQMGWAPFRSAIGRLRDPNFAAGVVFPTSVHFTVRPSGNVDADYRNSSGRDLRAASTSATMTMAAAIFPLSSIRATASTTGSAAQE